MKAVLMSIKPKWCELIARGRKTIEVRKTRPKLDTPFKVYIYCTKSKEKTFFTEELFDKYAIPYVGNGKVIGEFVCDKVEKGILDISEYVDSVNIGRDETCLRIADIRAYLGLQYIDIKGQHEFYGWHISDLVIYDKPKELSEFFKACDKPKGTDCSVCIDRRENSCKSITRPPQSWCYVEAKE